MSKAAPSTSSQLERYRMLGVEVDAIDLDQMIALTLAAEPQTPPKIMANHNLHSIHIYHRDESMRRFFARADYVLIDGMPLVWWGRLLGYPLAGRHRVTGVDLVWPLLEELEAHGRSLYFLGSAEEVGALAKQRLQERLPGLRLEMASGFFDAGYDSEETLSVVEKINAFAPDMLLVGMGMPRQERWIEENLDRLRAGIVYNQGAIFDYVAGVVTTPPRWAGRMGFEWLARLLHEPKRLWRRYLVEPVSLMPLLVRDLGSRLRGDKP